MGNGTQFSWLTGLLLPLCVWCFSCMLKSQQGVGSIVQNSSLKTPRWLTTGNNLSGKTKLLNQGQGFPYKFQSWCLQASFCWAPFNMVIRLSSLKTIDNGFRLVNYPKSMRWLNGNKELTYNAPSHCNCKHSITLESYIFYPFSFLAA